MTDITQIAENADMIVNGYAFTKCELGYKVLNLDNPQKAMVVSDTGEPFETTMDDIEIRIVVDYFLKNKKFMED